MNTLESTARSLVAPGKGVLAADESTGTITRRFDSVGVESTEQRRREYREMLFTTAGLEEFISGVILFDETIRQATTDGIAFPELLLEKEILPGIKVDKGVKALALGLDETVTEGLDGLRERLAEYRALGARFAKWRAVHSISSWPSANGIAVNAHALARYAALAQEAGMVPIVEPEVLMDGAHSIGESAAVTGRVLHAVFEELHRQGVDLRGTLLKPNMVLSGYAASVRASADEVAARTLDVFYRHVPAAVQGIVFLSGGQSDEDATLNLNAMNALGPHPWQLSFSFGRALQSGALTAWAEEFGGVERAQRSLYRRSQLNSFARFGDYSPELETTAVSVG